MSRVAQVGDLIGYHEFRYLGDDAALLQAWWMKGCCGGRAGAHVQAPREVHREAGPTTKHPRHGSPGIAQNMLLGHDPVVDDAATISRSPVPVKRWIVPVVAWAAVGLVEAFAIPNVSLLGWLVPPFELAFWLVAGVATARLVVRAGAGAVARAVVFLVLLALGLHFTNWSAFAPRSYFATHRYAFGAVAAEVRNGASDEYYGTRLPWYLADLSTTGKAAVVARQGDHAAILLPQALGVPDDAAGFVYFDGPDPRAVEADLFGASVPLTGGIDLGGGWWYLQPGD